MTPSPKTQKRLMINIFIVAAAIILFYWLVNNFGQVMGLVGWIFNVLAPFIAGFIISYFLSIPINGMQKLLEKANIGFISKRKKGISVILVYVLLAFGIYAAMQLLLPHVIAAIVDLVTNIPVFIQQFIGFIDSVNQGRQLPFDINLEELFMAMISAIPMDFFSYDVIMSQLRAVMVGATFVLNVFLAIISSIYFLFESEKLGNFLKRVMKKCMPPKAVDIVLGYGHKTDQYFKKYIFCVIIDCIVIAIIAPIVLTLLGSPYALFLGLLLGVMNFIPLFGSIIATVIAVIVVIFTQGLVMGAISAAVLFTMQQLDANVLQPRLYGGSLKLSPLLVIISVTAGGAVGSVIGGGLGGTVIGMFVSIPCVKVITNVVEDILEYKKPCD